MKRWVPFILFLLLFLLALLIRGRLSGWKWRWLRPVGSVSRGIIERVRPIFSSAAKRERLYRENQQFRQEIAQLRADLEQLRAARQIEKELHFASGEGTCLFLPILFRPPESYYSKVILGKGRAEGVTEGMPLLREEGLVGIVASASKHLAVGTLLTSPKLRVGVRNRRGGEVGILQGEREKGLEVLFLPSTADVKRGDLFVTSSLSHLFLPGVPVGRAVAMEKQKDSVTLRVQLEPAVNFSKLEWVCGYKVASSS